MAGEEENEQQNGHSSISTSAKDPWTQISMWIVKMPSPLSDKSSWERNARLGKRFGAWQLEEKTMVRLQGDRCPGPAYGTELPHHEQDTNWAFASFYSAPPLSICVCVCILIGHT